MLAGLLAALIMGWLRIGEDVALFVALLLAGLPVFLAGLVEDLTKRVRPLYRLIFAFASAGLAAWWGGAILSSLGVPRVDTVLAAVPALAVLLTIFAVGGVCHATNIIDGYNGLMGGVAIAILAALAYVSFAVGDMPLLVIAVSMVGALFGFLLWNFPKGLIFAGDAGAYLVGFLLAEISVLLVGRHPGVVSPWFPMLLMIYPVFETLFSIYRRKKRQAAAGLPDSMHFHQMVYKRLVRWMVGSREAKYLVRRNSLTAPYLWGVALFSIMPAVLFWRVQWLLQLCCVLFILLYLWLYRRIVQFRSPRWLVLHRREDVSSGESVKP
ncbi:MraY family glycosyltransferase [Paludibacterium denitrificans]|uniref:MraY family glycosyltransferase n=1 Tax=Paludibacterium denitrificans TaxID=2675226 RepID=UPI001E57C068|nr:glycosyltransferase [Paludibacterium denitrificans]